MKDFTAHQSNRRFTFSCLCSLYAEGKISFLWHYCKCDLKIFSFHYDVQFPNSGQADQSLGWIGDLMGKSPEYHWGKSLCCQLPAHGPLLGNSHNCLNILGLASSALAFLLAVWLLENLPTSFSLTFCACQNGVPLPLSQSLPWKRTEWKSPKHLALYKFLITTRVLVMTTASKCMVTF